MPFILINGFQSSEKNMSKQTWFILGAIIISINIFLAIQEEPDVYYSDSAKTALMVEQFARPSMQSSNKANSVDLPLPEKVANPVLITPAIGTKSVTLGMKEHEFIEQYPDHKVKTYETEPESKFIDAASGEIGVTSKNGIVDTVFLYFTVPDKRPFPGMTGEGISALSSVADVRNVYGVADQDELSVGNNFSLVPGANERYILYKSKGISFTFYNDILGSITVFDPQVFNVQP